MQGGLRQTGLVDVRVASHGCAGGGSVMLQLAPRQTCGAWLNSAGWVCSQSGTSCAKAFDLLSTWNLCSAAGWWLLWCCPTKQQWTGESAIGDAMLEVAARLPKAQLVITTRGTKGSICLQRQPTNVGVDPELSAVECVVRY
jgi:hypothetical protein